MTLRKSIVLLVVLAAIAVSVGCSSSSAPPAPLMVTMSAVSSPLSTNSQTPVTATVTNDSANAGVNWSCAPAGSCGSFSSTSSLSGVPVQYVAPAFIPSTTVVITATSVTTSTVSASSQAITIANASLADGTYVFNLAGTDNGISSGGGNSPYVVAGAFTVAAGAITGGEQDFGDVNVSAFDAITGGTVTTTSDGNIQITLITADTSIGVGGIETLNGALIPSPGSTYALINEYDASASGSGELDLQTSAAGSTPVGGYAFEIGGWEFLNGFPVAVGGILNVDGNLATPPTVGTISGTGSIFDVNDGGATSPAQTFAASTISNPPDSFGRNTFTLNPTAAFNQIVLVGYTVDSSRTRLVETLGDAFAGLTSGVAYSQASSLVGMFKSTNFSGNTYVTGMTGYDVAGSLQSASQLTANADGSMSGFLDLNDLVTVTPASPDPVSAAPSYTVDLTGRVTIAGLTDGSVVTTNLQAYLDGNGHALVITLDPNDALNGVGYQQAPGTYSSAALNNGLAVGFSGGEFLANPQFDAVGTVTADGVGTTTGIVDLNWLNSTAGTTTSGSTVVTGLPTYVDVPVTGTFTPSAASSSIFNATVTGVDVSTCPVYGVGTTACSADTFNYYLFDLVGDGFVIETDQLQLTGGRIASEQ
jgi:hypothetical protein